MNLTAEPEFERKDSDGSNCEKCEQVIIGQMVQLVMFIDYEPIYTRFKYCEYCYDNLSEKKV